MTATDLIRRLAPGQSSPIWTVRVAESECQRRLVSTDILLEAPIWTEDGIALILTGKGVLWRSDLDSGALEPIPIDGVPVLNNDHAIAYPTDSERMPS